MDIADYLQPVTINGLKGRMVHIPGPRPDSPEVLFVYGHHSSLERWWGIAQLFATKCSVSMVDLPGFGGMDSLYKMGKPATLDNLADYLADVIKQHFASKQLSVVGMSLGFVITTRMLQRHPELQPHINKVISLFGFAHKDDFIIPASNQRVGRAMAHTFSLPILASLYKVIALNPWVLRRAYHRTPNARQKFKGATPEQHKANMDFEIQLWQNDDTRTYWKTGLEFLTLDNTKVKIPLPVYHVAVANDRYFDNFKVEQHLRQIYSDFHLLAELPNGNHAPTRIATAKEATAFIPAALVQAVADITQVGSAGRSPQA